MDGAAVEDLVGTVVAGRYRLDAYVGEGAFGATYRASFPHRDGRRAEVAVKLTKLTRVEPSVADDLLAEARLVVDALAELAQHPARIHLVPVMDHGVAQGHDGRVFVVSEFVAGTDLGQLFGHYAHGVPPELLLGWMRQVVQAMAALHSLAPPLLHRDLKPDNIRLGADGCIRVLDFGLAARMLPHGYAPGQAGTQVYMAPETLLEGRSVAASDIYSIGVVFYQGLTGRHPFEDAAPPLALPLARQAEWRMQQRRGLRVEPPSIANRAIPPTFHWLDAVVLRCLDFECCGLRWFDAAELLQALNAPPVDRGGQQAAEARRLRSQGQWELARRCYEAALDRPGLPRELRFELMHELGGLLMVIGDFAAALPRLEQAWVMADRSALLRTREQRAHLLGQVARAARGCSNEYLAAQYACMSRQEAAGGRN